MSFQKYAKVTFTVFSFAFFIYARPSWFYYLTVGQDDYSEWGQKGMKTEYAYNHLKGAINRVSTDYWGLYPNDNYFSNT